MAKKTGTTTTPPLGFNLVNLIAPNDPTNLTIIGTNGTWDIRQHPNFANNRQAINSRVHAAVTYIADHADLGFVKEDEILDELIFLCLSFSYLTSNAVTMNQSAMYSRISFLQVGDGFPRDRGITGIAPIIATEQELTTSINQMLSLFTQNKTNYHIDVIIQFWLDILSCWSLENLFLGACTILEIIKQCERRRTGNNNLHFYNAITSVSTYLGITVLNRDWINMRNDIIHDGHLSSTHFPNKTKFECIEVCEDVMMWIDEFIHKIFNLGAVKQQRFQRGSLAQLNSYTTWA
ncbi:MAG: hypothetical protein KF687_06335 [Cyclobacteriaceae bacterium]|nr:hypothetical protein [Cyclobacteriaceae bacterium]